MKYVLLILCFGLVAERPTINLPPSCRQANWGGSCVYASTVSLLKWQGRTQTANWIRRHCGGGASLKTIVSRLESIDARYAYSTGYDVSFLEWSIRTRRGAGVVVWKGEHMVALVHLDSNWACIMDPNTQRFHWMSRGMFLADWRRSGGWAVAPVYTPASPLPRK